MKIKSYTLRSVRFRRRFLSVTWRRTFRSAGNEGRGFFSTRVGRRLLLRNKKRLMNQSREGKTVSKRRHAAGESSYRQRLAAKTPVWRKLDPSQVRNGLLENNVWFSRLVASVYPSPSFSQRRPFIHPSFSTTSNPWRFFACVQSALEPILPSFFFFLTYFPTVIPVLLWLLGHRMVQRILEIESAGRSTPGGSNSCGLDGKDR